MVVLECAGSIPTIFMPRGKVAPRMTETSTIATRDVVIAIVSNKGVRKTAALRQPATPNIILRNKPTENSFSKKGEAESARIVPTAKPRITKKQE